MNETLFKTKSLFSNDMSEENFSALGKITDLVRNLDEISNKYYLCPLDL